MSVEGASQMIREGYILRNSRNTEQEPPTLKEFNDALVQLLENQRPKGDY